MGQRASKMNGYRQKTSPPAPTRLMSHTQHTHTLDELELNNTTPAESETQRTHRAHTHSTQRHHRKQYN